MTRDPRVDPRPGDVVRVEDARGWRVFVVLGATWTAPVVVRAAVVHEFGPDEVAAAMLLSDWRERMAAATVLYPAASAVAYEGAPALGILRDEQEKR